MNSGGMLTQWERKDWKKDKEFRSVAFFVVTGQFASTVLPSQQLK